MINFKPNQYHPMHTYQALLVILLLSTFIACTPSYQKKAKSDTIESKVDSLLSLMTLEEKIGQMNMYSGRWEFTGPVPTDNKSQDQAEMIRSGRVGAMLNVLTAEGTREAQEMAVENSRLGIPLLFGYDVIHGYKTIFPIPLAQAASFDPEVARKGSEIAAFEAASSGIHWTFAPMIDISRNARWGRIMESPGEDPYLATVMAEAWIKGFQGDDLSSPFTLAACAKHFAGYGYSEAGRDYNTVEISESTLHNVVLPPFKAAVDVGVATFMNAFNDLNGVPATGSEYLQRTILKGQWGFQGLVVSDWGSIVQMIPHGYASDSSQAAAMAAKAGSDMDMEGHSYENYLHALVENGSVDLQLIDDAVKRILTLKFQLGLFDDPYRYCDAEREKENNLTAANLSAARDAARRSIVLLKNENQLLPISKSTKSIAVIGELANSKDIHLGSWRAQGITDSGISLLEGIQQAVSTQTKVSYTPGYKLTTGKRSFVKELTFAEDDQSGFAAAIQIAKTHDIVILAVGEDCWQSGEGRSQTDIALRGEQQELFDELIKVNSNVIVVLSNGRPLAIPEIAQKAPAILETWFLGSEAGTAIAEVLFGDYNPSGKLPVSFPYNSGQTPIYYSRKNTGRPLPQNNDPEDVFWSHYTDSPNDALFPFGYGLSYASFELRNFNAEVEASSVNISVDISNNSDRTGTETVQVYIRDVAASLIRPIKELKAFQKIEVAPGETKRLQFQLSQADLSFYSTTGALIFEPGEFEIMVGFDSKNLKRQTVSVN